MRFGQGIINRKTQILNALKIIYQNDTEEEDEEDFKSINDNGGEYLTFSVYLDIDIDIKTKEEVCKHLKELLLDGEEVFTRIIHIPTCKEVFWDINVTLKDQA